MAKPNTLFKDTYNRALEILGAEAILPSESELGTRLAVSRTTVRAILARMEETGLIRWNKREKVLLRKPGPSDAFPDSETDTLGAVIERGFMHRILAGGATPGDLIGEADLARDLGVGVSAVREFLIRFSRFGLIEKRRNSQWVLKGFTRDFALELTDVRDMFELRSAQRFLALPEIHPAWAALERIEADHLDLLASIETRYGAFSQLDERFHRLIHEASGNRFVIDFYDVIAMIFHYHYQWNKAGEQERNRVAIEEHLDYIGALRSLNTMDVEFYCRKHLRSARQTLLQSIPGGPDEENGGAADIERPAARP